MTIASPSASASPSPSFFEPSPAGLGQVLLVQVRSDPRAAEHERLCFLDATGMAPGELATWNVEAWPEIRWRDVADADALIVGGAGAHSVTREYPFSGPLTEVVRRWVGEERPFFGSCWGHQFLAAALGGEVVTDLECAEVGSFDVALTEAGGRDPLLAGMGPRFTAQFGHNDRVRRMPPGAVELASTERCRHQVIRLGGLPVYGTQFHCEMTADHMRERLHMYRDEYLPGDDAEAELDRRLRPSPMAASLMARFLELFRPRRERRER